MGAAISKSSSKSTTKDGPECSCKECIQHTHYWDRSFFLTSLWESTSAERSISKVWNIPKLTTDKEGQRVLDTSLITVDKLSTRKFRRWYRNLDYSIEVWARYTGKKSFSPLNLAAHDSQRFLERLVSSDFDQKKLFEKYKVEMWFTKKPKYHKHSSYASSLSSSSKSSDGSSIQNAKIIDPDVDLAAPIKTPSKKPVQSKSLSGELVTEIKWKIMAINRKPNDPHYYGEEYPEMAHIQTVLHPLKRHRTF